MRAIAAMILLRLMPNKTIPANANYFVIQPRTTSTSYCVSVCVCVRSRRRRLCRIYILCHTRDPTWFSTTARILHRHRVSCRVTYINRVKPHNDCDSHSSRVLPSFFFACLGPETHANPKRTLYVIYAEHAAAIPRSFNNARFARHETDFRVN